MLTDRHVSRIRGTLSCLDRVLLTGTLPDICYPEALARELTRRRIRFLDHKSAFAQPIRDDIRQHAERLAQESGLDIEHIRLLFCCGGGGGGGGDAILPA